MHVVCDFIPIRREPVINISRKKEEPFMKNAHTGKIYCHILTVLLCALVLVMLACTFAPYYTISEPYHFVLNQNPTLDHYSLVDVMWMDTNVVTTFFTEDYPSFDINYFVTNLVLSFIFALATVVTCVVHLANEMRRFPSMVSGVFTHICGLLWVLFTMMGYLNNAMLDLGVPAFVGIRTVLIAVSIIGAVVYAVRLVIWILTEIKVSQERKSRLALL